MSGRPFGGAPLKDNMYKTCETTGKLRFPTEPIAQLELGKARRLHIAQGRRKIEKRYFLCDDCGGRHLTSWESNEVRQLG